MSILDLQGMATPVVQKGPPAGSRTSKDCNNGSNNSNSTVQSNTSLLLCTLVL
jgi:Lanthionine-containing peptide SapB precursor RamS